MARSGELIVNPVTREQIIFRKTAADTNGELLQFEDILEAGGIGPPEHLHPSQQERFEVRSGTLRIRVAGKEQVVAMVPPFEMYLAGPPVPLQKALFAVLGPLARLRGYRATYPRYSSAVTG